MSFGELDQLVGEVLPERTVLSTVTDFSGGAPSGGDNVVADFGGDRGGNTTAISACHTSEHHGTPGLVGALGLGSNNPTVTQTCTPAAVSSSF